MELDPEDEDYEPQRKARELGNLEDFLQSLE